MMGLTPTIQADTGREKITVRNAASSTIDGYVVHDEGGGGKIMQSSACFSMQWTRAEEVFPRQLPGRGPPSLLGLQLARKSAREFLELRGAATHHAQHAEGFRLQQPQFRMIRPPRLVEEGFVAQIFHFPGRGAQAGLDFGLADLEEPVEGWAVR